MPYQSLLDYKSHARTFKVKGTGEEFELAWWQTPFEESKPTILFIHGFPSASWNWHYQWQALKNDYNLVAMDMLGYGISDKPAPYGYKLAEQAQFFAQLLESLNIKRCHVLAHDYGDSVAQELLYLVEEKRTSFDFQSVTFLNGGLFSEAHRPLLTQKLMKGRLGPFISRFLKQSSLQTSFERIFGPHSQPSKQDIEILWHFLEYKQGTRAMPYLLKYLEERKQRRADWVKTMQTTEIPMYFINGAYDPISGEHMRVRFTELLPESRTTSLNVGHYPQIEAPDEVLTHFRAFIETAVA